MVKHTVRLDISIIAYIRCVSRDKDSDTHRDIQNTVKSNLYITDNDSKNGSHRQSQRHWQLRTSEFNSDRIRDRWLQ